MLALRDIKNKEQKAHQKKASEYLDPLKCNGINIGIQVCQDHLISFNLHKAHCFVSVF